MGNTSKKDSSIRGIIDSVDEVALYDKNCGMSSSLTGFVTTKSLNLAVADQIASLAIQAAKNNGFKPISVCVMDPSGAEIVTKRMDGCPALAYPKISAAKATTCVATKSSSRDYGNKYLRGSSGAGPVGPETFVRVLNQISIMDGKVAAFQGGILVREKSTGEIVGSVGVSGAAGDEDEYCAIYGVQNCEMGLSSLLVTVPPKHSCTTVAKK